MPMFYAKPYDLSATGFYFETMAEYDAERAKCTNTAGQPVEEFEIQFIHGDELDAVLFEVIGVNQSNIGTFIEKKDEWIEYEKHVLILVVGKHGYCFDMSNDDPNKFWIDIYYCDTLRELAERFVHDYGVYGDISEFLQPYIDYDAIARDLSAEYTEITIAGEDMVYRCT